MSSPGGSLPSLHERADDIAKSLLPISDDDGILVISHLDADGLSAGSIVLQALINQGLSPRIRIVKQLDGDTIKEISGCREKYILFTDLGSGQKSLLKGLDKKELLVVDHHQPDKVDAHIKEINPHLFGFDGSSELSAAGTAFLLALKMNEGNANLAPLAIVGALGDLQDKGERSTLVGINAKIAEDAEKAGLLTIKKGLKLYGFESRPLVQCMEYTLDPYLPGLSGDQGACYKFIKDLGIDPRKHDGSWKSIADLSKEEQKTVINGVIKYLISQGLTSREAESIVGAIYIFPGESPDGPLRDAREFASSINACGRMGRYGLGISICLGDRDRALAELKEITLEYKHAIAEHLQWIQQNQGAVRILPHVQALYGGTQIDDKIIGTIISIAFSTKPFSLDRPIVGFASTEGVVKVSARGTQDLIRRGLNLGKVMKEVSERLGGTGGGHNIAAGAQIPAGKEDEFLGGVEEMVAKTVVGVKL